MPRMNVDVPDELLGEIDRMVREGWYPDRAAVGAEALRRFVHGKSLLGDSPRLLLRFASDALNDSKPETALRFVDRAALLLSGHQHPDLTLYRSLVELKIQILLVLDRRVEARAAVEEARDRLPNNPGVNRWLEQLEKRKG